MTRMSVGEKQNLVLKNVEEERAQFEAMKDQVVEEESKKSSEESDSNASSLSDASSSDSETGTDADSRRFMEHFTGNSGGGTFSEICSAVPCILVLTIFPGGQSNCDNT